MSSSPRRFSTMCCRITCSSACATRSQCTSDRTIPKTSSSSKSAFVRKRYVSYATQVLPFFSSHRSDSPLRRHAGVSPVGDLHSRLPLSRPLLPQRPHARIRRYCLSRPSGEPSSRDRSGVSPRLTRSTLVHNLLFDSLFLPLRSASVASFLDAVTRQLCRQVVSALTLEPPHCFLVAPHLPVTLRRSLVRQPHYSSLPLPEGWRRDDADEEWRRAWHVRLLAHLDVETLCAARESALLPRYQRAVCADSLRGAASLRASATAAGRWRLRGPGRLRVLSLSAAGREGQGLGLRVSVAADALLLLHLQSLCGVSCSFDRGGEKEVVLLL